MSVPSLQPPRRVPPLLLALVAAVGATLALALVPVATLPGGLTPQAAASSSCDGVTVRVERPGSTRNGCAAGAPDNGFHALRGAGFSYTEVPSQPGMVCTIDGYPQRCDGVPEADAYWSYWHAAAGATSWTYSTRGAGSRTPPPGSHEAWVFGAGAPPSGPPPSPSSGGSGGGGSDSGGSDSGDGSDSADGSDSGDGSESGGSESGGSGGGTGSGGSGGSGSDGGSGSGDDAGSGASAGSAGPGAGGSSEGDVTGGRGDGDVGAGGTSGSGADAGDDGSAAEPDDADGDGAEADTTTASGHDAREQHAVDLHPTDGDAAATAEGDGDDATDDDLAAPADTVTVGGPGTGGGAAGAAAGSVLVAGLVAAGVLRARRRDTDPGLGA